MVTHVSKVTALLLAILMRLPGRSTYAALPSRTALPPETVAPFARVPFAPPTESLASEVKLYRCVRTAGTDVTVSVLVRLLPPKLAMSVVVPAETARTRPLLELTVRTPGFPEVKVAPP